MLYRLMELNKKINKKTLGKYLPPWTVTRAAWNAVLCPGMSGIATDVMLFNQHGGRLVHRYRMYADPLPHVSLRGPVMKMCIYHLTFGHSGKLPVLSMVVNISHVISYVIHIYWGGGGVQPA